MIVRKLYDEYVRTVYTMPEPMGDQQEMQVQAAFFAGAAGILHYLETHADESSMDVTGQDIDMMESIYAEFAAHQPAMVKRMEKYWPGKRQ